MNNSAADLFKKSSFDYELGETNTQKKQKQ